jgi:hypothetical protein
MISIMQLIPAISITSGVPTNLIPLSVVLAFDGVITAREDYNRHVDDKKANTSKGTMRSYVEGRCERKVARSKPLPSCFSL